MMHKGNSTRFRFDKCEQCESVFLNPLIAEEKLDEYYSDSYLPYRGSKAWGKYSAFVEKSQRRVDDKRLQRCIQHFDRKSPIDVLDLGCGRPSFLELLSQNTDWRLHGLDFSDEGWKDETFNSNIKLYTDSIETCPFDRRFDLITMWHYLEHDQDPRATMKRVGELLKPGGRLIAEVPDYQSYTARFQKAFWEGWHTPRHHVLFAPKAFPFLLQGTALSTDKVLRHGTLDAFTLWWMGQMEKKGIDWSKSMEDEFWPLLIRNILTAPIFAFEKQLPLGIQTLFASKKG